MSTVSHKSHSFSIYLSFSLSLSFTHTYTRLYFTVSFTLFLVSLMLPLYSIYPKLPQSLALTLSHSHMYSPLNLSRFRFITLLASHSLSLISRSFLSQSMIIAPSIGVILSTGLIFQSRGHRSRRLVYQAYLQHLSAGFNLGSFIGNIHLHSSSSIIGIRQTGTYLFSLSLSLYLAHARSLTRFLSLTHSLSFSLNTLSLGS